MKGFSFFNAFFLIILPLIYSCNVIQTLEDGETTIRFGNGSNEHFCIRPSTDPNSLSLSTGLTEFFHFDEIAGNRNGVMSNMNLVESGSVASTQGVCGNSLDTGTMNNSNELIPTPNTTLAFGINDFSISFWVKFDPTSSGYQFFMGDNNNVSQDMYIGFYNNGTNISLEVWMAGPNSVMNLSNVFLPDQTWYHVAL
ncbi:MAG: hypothetical protein KC478_03815, partial [Bacteriovoracaceae bacterium]|nr:hypothetical protein [Bacteriovoracaceae bacterium]